MASTRWYGKARGVAALCALTLAFASFSASNAAPRGAASLLEKSTGKLSSRLDLLAQTASRPQDAKTQARSLSLAAEGPGSLLRNAAGAVLVYIRLASVDDANLAAIRATGAEIIHVAPEYRTVTAYVRPTQLQAITAIASVANVREELQPVVAHKRVSSLVSLRTPWNTPVVQAGCPSGIVSEGDTQLRAAQARSTYNVNGAGITVGILSDSFAGVASPTSAAQDVASGDLPGPGNPCGFTTPTSVIEDLAVAKKPTDEGRAMAQIVHDLAPGANLAFVTAFTGLFQFADNIIRLRDAGASVLVDDIGYFAEPFYQDGPVSNAIDQVTSQGALYFTAAGNANSFDEDGNLVASYEAPSYRPTACPALQGRTGPTTAYANDCHSFDPAGGKPSNAMLLEAGGGFTLIFQWAEPWYGVTTDLDVYVVDDSGVVLASSADTNNGAQGTQQPFESLNYSNETGAAEVVYVIIARSSGTATPRMKYITDAQGLAATEYNAANNTVDTFGPTVYGHAAARGAISTAAVPFDDPTTTELFSSYGPALILFGPTNGTAPAAALGAAEVRNKPDVAATDGGQNTFFGQQDSNGTYRFTGTSAAAPHGAAVAALMRQRANQAGKIFTQNVLERLLKTTATPMPNDDVEATGAGLINAVAAVGAIDGLPVPVRSFLPLQTR